jgi:MoxR-like ATPase
MTAATTALAKAVLDEIERAVVGKKEALTLILLAILARGHVLVEDLPGIGKTLIARSFATALGLRFTRIQFTPDLQPADLIGSPVPEQSPGATAFRPGPIFTNLLLADEIDRAAPRTQAALLDAMTELEVSLDGETRRLSEPFIVLATDRPADAPDTYPLPETHLDRFMLRVRLGYLPHSSAVEMLQRRLDRGSAPAGLEPVLGVDEVLAMRESLESVTVHPDVLDYIVKLAAATREHPGVDVGVSPRAELDLVQLARARAVLCGRDFVGPDDVKALAGPAWAHRVRGAEVIDELLGRLAAPRLDRPA